MKSCLWCDKPLPKRRRKYCSDDCSHEYFVQVISPLWWSNAVKMALERASNKCENCGSPESNMFNGISYRTNLEVHHKVKLEAGEVRHNSPKNKQDNLEVLCTSCHGVAHHKLNTAPSSQLGYNLGNEVELDIEL